MSAFGPYTPIRQAGNLYFISGQLGVDPKTKSAKDSIAEQTHQALKNLQSVLKSANLLFGNVVKTTIFLQNIDDYQVVNEIYASYFAGIPPARSCVEVSALPKVADKKVLIEIEAVAFKAS